MTQALFTSMTGMNAGTEQLTVVSDNIANMNTTAYKTSRVDFQDVWYATKTTGTNSTVNSGGTNPYQVGVGVQTSAITKDFGASSTNTTGRKEDMAITGDGWFTVVDTDGKTLLTRDGSFSLDENGFLCTANGFKVIGMDQLESFTSSNTPIKVPTSIKVSEMGTPTGIFSNMFASDLNSLGSSHNGFTGGDFTVVATAPDGGQTELTITLPPNVNDMTMANLATTIQGQAKGHFTVAAVNGKLDFSLGTAASLKFRNVEGGTNFLNVTGVASSPLVGDTYSSKILNTSASIGQIDDITAESTKNYDSFSFGKDGLMTVTYDDGSILTIKANDDGSTYFSYQNANGVIINDDVQNSGNASLYVDPNVLEKANMQMQLAKVVNNGGLVAEGNNQYSVGVNCGDVLYTAANTNGVGGLATGALEASNVDLAQQFSNMILAQRLVQANSQVFSGANSLLETLVYLGQ